MWIKSLIQTSYILNQYKTEGITDINEYVTNWQDR